MLKFLFWILIAANGALFAFRMGYLDSLLPAKSEPQRVVNQLNASRIKLAAATASTSASAASAASAQGSASAQASVSAPVASATVPPSAPPQKLIPCTEVGDFTAEEARKFEPRLAELLLGDRQSRRAVQEVATYMVYMPPMGSKEGAEKKAGELKKMGVTNFFIIQDNSKMRWGISMGVFKSESAAKNHLERLKKQGVRSARVGARSVSGSKNAYVLRDLDQGAQRSLDKLMADFPSQRARECGRE